MTYYNYYETRYEMKQRIKAYKIWAIIATFIAATLASILFVQHCNAKYESWKVERAACMEEAQYYWNAWCDDDNNLVY